MKKQGKNLILLVSGDLGSRLLGFIAVTYLARTLGASDFGKINIGLSLLAYAMLFAGSGIPILGTREVSGKTGYDPTFIGNLILIRFFLSLLSFVAVYLISLQFYSSEIIYLITIYLLYIFTSIFLLDWFFQAMQNMSVIVLARLSGMIIYLICIYIWVQSSADYINVAWSWLAQGTMICLIIGLIYFKKGNRISFKIDGNFFRTIKQSFTLSGTGIIAQIILQSPVIFLSWYGTNEDIGFFNISFRVVLFALIIDRVFYMMFFPLISREALKNKTHLSQVFTRFLKAVTLVAFFMTFMISFFAQHIITLLFGTEYLPSVEILRVMAAYFYVTLSISVFSFTLIGMGREKDVLIVTVFGALIYFMSIYPVYSWLGVPGLAIVIIINEFFLLCTLSILLYRKIAYPIFRTFIFPLIITFFLLVVNGCMEINLWTGVFMVCLIVFPFLVWAMGFKKEDFRYFKKAVI